MGTLSDYFHRIMNGPAFRPGEEMKYEAIRLASFKQWPHWSPVQPTLLARAGFYYANVGDEVVCFSCKGKIKEWQKGDDPPSEHRRWFSDCAVVTGTETENVPLEPAREYQERVSRNLSNNRRMESLSLQDSQGHVDRNDAEAGGALHSNYKYRFEEARLRSYATWTSRCISREELARTGFYYLGDSDRVQCAFCRGILRNWEPGDDAAAEHKKHFPDCPLISGRDVGNVKVSSGATNRASSKNAVSLRKVSPQNLSLPICLSYLMNSGSTIADEVYPRCGYC